MTVCIAATFEHGTSNQGIACITDRQFTDEGTGLKSVGSYYKMLRVAANIV